MGNRGCLHEGARTLTRRRWTTITWVTCQLSFGGRRRELMRSGYYTELFSSTRSLRSPQAIARAVRRT